MSTFNGLLVEIDGVSVDRFNMKNKFSRVYFLSHCHSDHVVGLYGSYFTDNHPNRDIFLYTSEINSVILKNQYPGLAQNVKALNFHDTYHILIPAEQQSDSKYVSVKIIPAGHCPGSVMFLFTTIEGKNILYTGDFRISGVDLPKLKQLNDEFGKAIVIDKMYFDSTFWDEKFPDFPSRDLSCDVICDIIAEWISKGKDYLVLLNICAYYGSEGLFIALAKKLKMKIHVREKEFQTYRHIVELDDVVTLDSNETQIHCCTKIKRGMKSIECHPNLHTFHIRSIKPSAFRWIYHKEKSNIFKEDDDSAFFVCYSSHSSFNELKEFVNYFKPKSIEPCVVLENKDFYKSINDFCKDFLEVPCERLAKRKIAIKTPDEFLALAHKQNTNSISDSSDDDVAESKERKRNINPIYSEIQSFKNQNALNKKKFF